VCPGGTTDCGDCVDTSNDPNNCGGCGILCQNGADCVNGVCQTPCPLCQVNENGTCVPTPCGACEVCSDTTGQCEPTCFPGQTCVDGTCQSPRCGPGTTDCGGVWCCPAGQLCLNNVDTGAPLCCTPGFGRREECFRLGLPLVCCMPQ
jgi:hypothetical protein